MPTVINRNGLSAVIHVTANSTVVIAGNSSVSNIASGNSTVYETLTGGNITQIWWGAPAGYWTVKRGANTVLVLSESGYLDFAGCGSSLMIDATANVVANLVTSTTGFLMIEVQKTPTSTGYTA